MTTTWFLVANASHAKLYASVGNHKSLELIKELEHPESRKRNAELVSDRAGHMQSSGNGLGAHQPQTTPKQREADLFAQELARDLNHGRSTNRFGRLVLIAPSAFMGLLNGKIDKPTAALIVERYEKDYTQTTSKELLKHLQSGP
jgi:protein required for attachment to host cells